MITQRGRASAVLVSADAYERTQYENEPPVHAARGMAILRKG
ncbi:MAG: type II toxin-antitoxin system Phd/YefM family antitoxin [Actinobacteria bacterium]|nr:type II toxin-antitoxin system Phd/YefM family antitoxin [Actinomycetota bacterium]MCL5887446.1 type II toxin-antitoxin system Phd/YefM family antitoxin [Actinomycetota bacterium]